MNSLTTEHTEEVVLSDKTDMSGQGPISFEQALERLERVVASLEEGRCGLSESLAHYERGVKLLRECHDLLSHAERKIELLAGFDAQGAPITEPLFDAEGDSLEEKGNQRSRRRSATSRSSPRVKPDDDIPF